MSELIFVIDPMCSWCWGFHPIIEKLRLKHADKYNYSIVVGGLRTKGQMIWNTQNKDYLHQNWNAVSKRTGQLFSYSLLNKSSFNYDTYPSCKAIVTVRELYGDTASFEYLTRIQKAFYIESIDITNIHILSNYITQDKKAFLSFYQSNRAELLMQHDFSKARSMGANSFPSIVKIDTDGHMVCLSGYRDLDEILKI